MLNGCVPEYIHEQINSHVMAILLNWSTMNRTIVSHLSLLCAVCRLLGRSLLLIDYVYILLILAQNETSALYSLMPFWSASNLTSLVTAILHFFYKLRWCLDNCTEPYAGQVCSVQVNYLSNIDKGIPAKTRGSQKCSKVTHKKKFDMSITNTTAKCRYFWLQVIKILWILRKLDS